MSRKKSNPSHKIVYTTTASVAVTRPELALIRYAFGIQKEEPTVSVDMKFVENYITDFLDTKQSGYFQRGEYAKQAFNLIFDVWDRRLDRNVDFIHFYHN